MIWIWAQSSSEDFKGWKICCSSSDIIPKLSVQFFKFAFYVHRGVKFNFLLLALRMTVPLCCFCHSISWRALVELELLTVCVTAALDGGALAGDLWVLFFQEYAQSRMDTVLLIQFAICCFQMEQDAKANQEFFCRCRAVSSNFLSAKASYQTVSKELPCGSDWAGQKWWGLYISCLWRSSKSSRQRRSENKYYLQFTSGNGFYLHSSKWFVAHWGTDLLNLSLVSPDTGEPSSMNTAHGVGRQAREHSCRKVLPRLGRLDTAVKEQPWQVFPRAIVIFLSFFLPTWALSHSILLLWSCLKLGEETLLSLLLFPLQSLRSGGNVGFSVSNNPRSKKERRNAGLGIHVTNGLNWCHAPNVWIFVWNQCLEQFTICLMCPCKQKGFMELGSLDVFYPRWRALSHERGSCISCSLSLFRLFRVN